MKISITFYVTHFLVFVLFISGLFADLPFIQNNKYPNGPQKDWNQRQFKKYYRWIERHSNRTADSDDQILRRQDAIISGNKITTQIWNYGSISEPGNRVTDIVWEGLGYGYEFGPFICAEVPLASNSHPDAYPKVVGGDTTWFARIISDGLVTDPERSPDGSEYWTWEPLAYSDEGIYFADPNYDKIPTASDIDRDFDGKPDSWAYDWYNANLKEYVWPGDLRQGASNADEEAFFVCDDRNNKEFEYYPFPEDSARKGLGLQIEYRYYQWANPLAEDIIFLIYKITNKSSKDLNEVTFGMWGDPHIGGPSDWSDDLSYFDHDINMVYCWDEDGSASGSANNPGYFGYKFLESPGNPYDQLDNDDDGMVDESRDNGIDDDNDWDPEKDDIGVDGVPNTGDMGEGDGLPTAGDQYDIREPGEPNFEWTDLDESDMVGLTGFSSPAFSGTTIADDQRVYDDFLQPGVFDSANATQSGDYVFIYSSGPISLPAGETRRFSIALLIGEDYDDLTLNAITSQDIYERNYQFAKPPDKPTITAVPGDERITLYWDHVAEESLDPISEEYDFEGYVIYRSTHPQFLDQQTITDANGSKFLFEPLKMFNGAPARFDLDNDYFGMSSVVYPGRGAYYTLGDNTGLVHSYVDSNNVLNGQTYYYAVVSYDHGSEELQIPPSECSKTITVNPTTNELIIDVNTIRIVPSTPAIGLVRGTIKDNLIEHRAGVTTGKIILDIVDYYSLENENQFEITFRESPTRYSIKDLMPIEDQVVISIEQYRQLSYQNIDLESVQVYDVNGNIFVINQDYEILDEMGKIKGIAGGSITDGNTYTVSYLYYPIVNSKAVSLEETNPIVDGIKVTVQDIELALNVENTKWSISSSCSWSPEVIPFNGADQFMYPGAYEVRFFDEIVDTSSTTLHPSFGISRMNFEVWDVTPGRIPMQEEVTIIEEGNNPDSLWSPGDRAIIMDGEPLGGKWEFTFFLPDSGDTISAGAGDVFFIDTHRPFAESDTLLFTTVASQYDKTVASG
ncbi:MAG: hypothetical protein MKZ99_00005, partial [Candidatus Marinimicrobia bacterium]|nr:hypothetical protein [Candidatus Neomarinimicrobiota bacterium]